MQNKTVLVTGKNGNISKRVAVWLSQRGYEVDNLSLRGADWRNVSLQSYDAIVHVAGIVPKTGVNAEDFYKINSELTKELAIKAKQEGVRHFIYISSMAVYGKTQQINEQKGKITLETQCNPISDYGKSKLKAEDYLCQLEDESFLVARVRVPSIYGVGKTEYLDQYQHLNEKLGRIPVAFSKNYKSFIYLDNLCELLYLIILNTTEGIICPDDGPYSALDICSAISPRVKKSKVFGFLFNTLLRKSNRVVDYFGAIFYDESLTNIFNGAYRVKPLREAIRISYEG